MLFYTRKLELNRCHFFACKYGCNFYFKMADLYIQVEKEMLFCLSDYKDSKLYTSTSLLAHYSITKCQIYDKLYTILILVIRTTILDAFQYDWRKLVSRHPV